MILALDIAHIAESIEFQMSLMLFSALAGYQIASYIRLPAVVGAVLAGLLIGPSLLNLVTYSDFVASVAHIGAVILLFIVGLEVNIAAIAKLRYGVIAFFGVVIPWVGGFLLATAFGLVSSRAVIIGVALTATSIALTAETFREAGLLKSPIAQAVIACAILDDVLALMAVGLVGSGDMSSLEWKPMAAAFLKAAVFLAVGAYGGRVWVSKALVHLDRTKFAQRLPEISFVFAMMTAFGFALLAEIAGLSAIVGAFIAGLALEGVELRKAHQVEEGADYLRAIFSAVFFVSLGVLADFSSMSWDEVWFALLLLLVAIATKILGCGLPALAFSYSPRDALILGLGMAPRGEVAMVVALLALTSGVIEQTSFLAIVVVAIGTSMIVPPLLRMAIRT